MKKILLCSFFAFTLAACDSGTQTNETSATTLALQDGNSISLSGALSKSYTAQRDNVARQYHIIDFTAPMTSSHTEFSKTLEKQGYTQSIKDQTDDLIQAYYRKPNSPLLVANFKRAGTDGKATQLSISWETTSPTTN